MINGISIQISDKSVLFIAGGIFLLGVVFLEKKFSDNNSDQSKIMVREPRKIGFAV